MNKWTDEQIKKIQSNLLISLHKDNPVGEEVALNDKIKVMYEEINGKPYPQNARAINICFDGCPPGVGIFAMHSIATKQVAEKLGLNFVQSPDNNYKPGKSDLIVFEPQIEFGGLPFSQHTESNTGKVKEFVSSQAKGVVVVCDSLNQQLIEENVSNKRDGFMFNVVVPVGKQAPSCVTTRAHIEKYPEELVVKIPKGLSDTLNRLRKPIFVSETEPPLGKKPGK